MPFASTFPSSKFSFPSSPWLLAAFAGFALCLSPANAATDATQPTAASLPDAPSALLYSPAIAPSSSSSDEDSYLPENPFAAFDNQQQPTDAHGEPIKKPQATGDVDANGNPIPLNRQQPKRILGFMPNFRTVSAGAVVHKPGWKYNFTVANHQALDYSTFIFLGLTTITAEWTNAHPALGKGADGFYAYLWRGFLDKTDGTYLSAWFLPSLLHEDTRYYPLGNGHSVPVRILYVISRQGVSRTYGGHNTPAFATLGGKVLTQIISREYYPTGATSFSVLATKFGYSCMRDVGFSSIREFYPDVAAHYIRKHREKAAALAAAKDAQSAGVPVKQ